MIGLSLTCKPWRPAAVALLAAATLAGAETIPLSIPFNVDGVSYSEEFPKPEDVIGHQVGTRHTRASQLVDYFRAVATISDRVEVRQYGRTYEGRPLIHAIVTSAENHAKLEQLRIANLALSDPPQTVPDERLSGMPAVIYQGFSVHGNEASASEAALLLLYHLAAGQGEAVDQALDNLIVIIDPCMNPDGRDRFVNWVNGNRGGKETIDSQDREHREPWPGGRTNHYWFDLNRDWLPAQLVESQARLELFFHWRPQVVTDHHEMGPNSTFFFQPGIPSRNNPSTPKRVYELTAEMARYHARGLERIGSLFYTEESFDDFYYGKGSTYPDINGAVGILFEQASSRALKRETENGILDYGFTVRNQLSTALTTVEASVAIREKLLRHQRDFYASYSEAAAKSAVKGYIVSTSGDRRNEGLALAQLLRRHRIRLFKLGRPFEGGGLSLKRNGGYVIPVDQPQTRLLQSMFQPMTEFEDNIFYDVSTWNLPMAFGVDYAPVSSGLEIYGEGEIEEFIQDGGVLYGIPTQFIYGDYAYVMEWGRYFSPRALYRLQEKGIRTRVATRPFEILVKGTKREIGPGAVIIPVAQRRGEPATKEEKREMALLMRELIGKDHVHIHSVDTGLTPTGPDLGGASTQVAEKPSIALLSGRGTNAYQVGQVWHLLSERMEMQVSLLDVGAFNNADLSRYNRIILGTGNYSSLDLDKLKGWLRRGGVLIAFHNGASWAVRSGLTDEKLKVAESKSEPTPYGEVQRNRGAQLTSGAIFEIELDSSHPLAFGRKEKMAVFRSHNNYFQPSANPGSNVAVYSDSPLLSGYISAENLERLPGTAAILARSAGRGRVILFADDPNFRAFWWGSNSLFMNAVFFGGIF